MNDIIGTSVFGLRCPIIRPTDDLETIVISTLEQSELIIDDNDVLGITESIVAKCENNFVTITDVANEIKALSDNADTIILINPVYSRNRFSMMLKAFAQASGKKVIVVMPEYDEVGNYRGLHKFTKVNYMDYYTSIINDYDKVAELYIEPEDSNYKNNLYDYLNKICGTEKSAIFVSNVHKIDELKNDIKEHISITSIYDLRDICKNKCDWGLLGSSMASDNTLKLFPSKSFAQNLVNNIQIYIYGKFGKKIEVMVYGDGCFHDPVCNINEFCDPVVSPAYTSGLEGTPNDLKLKYLVDNDFLYILSQDEIQRAVKSRIRNKDKDLVGKMESQGTTPRRYTDLLGSLMDLCTGSGDKGTPLVYIKGYFKNYAN